MSVYVIWTYTMQQRYFGLTSKLMNIMVEVDHNNIIQ